MSTDSAFREAQDLLIRRGGRFVRDARHGQIWRLPNGAVVNLNPHSTDWRGGENMLRDVRKAVEGAPEVVRARDAAGMTPTEADAMQPLGPAPWEMPMPAEPSLTPRPIIAKEEEEHMETTKTYRCPECLITNVNRYAHSNHIRNAHRRGRAAPTKPETPARAASVPGRAKASLFRGDYIARAADLLGTVEKVLRFQHEQIVAFGGVPGRGKAKRVEKAREDVDRLRAEVAEMRKQRDEARATLARLKMALRG